MKRSDLWAENLAVLGLPGAASWEEIQARYRQLVLAYHPDVNPSREAAERFRLIAVAYEALADLQREQRERSPEEMSKMYDDPKVRQLSVEELGMRLRYSSSANVRAASACLLGSIHGKQSRQMLLQAGRDSDDTVRRVVLESLGKVGKPGDLVRFLPCLNRDLAGPFFRTGWKIWAQAIRALFGRWMNSRGRESWQ